MQYDWEGDVPLWYGLRSEHIDWRYTGWDGAPNSTVMMDYIGDHGDKAEFLAFFMEQVRCVWGVIHTLLRGPLWQGRVPGLLLGPPDRVDTLLFTLQWLPS